MKSTTVRHLQHHFKDVLEVIRGGQSVQVTSRGKPVARLVPIEDGGTVTVAWPDFKSRLEAIYGDEATPDSRSVIDEIREERM